MELDDLKKQWKETTPGPSVDAIREAIEKKIPSFERSGRGIRKAFWIEMFFALILYLAFVAMVFYFREKMPAYMYKITFVIIIATLPIVYRLYKSQRWINSIDYSMDVRSNIEAFVKYYKKTLWIYEWGTYIIILITLILIFLDEAFQKTSPLVKWTLVGYILAVSLLTRPYIRFAYGKKLKVFEDFLKE